MLNLSGHRIFLARAVVDMRKSFDTLADVIRLQLRMDPLSGDAFVFVGHNRRRVKVLVWDGSGFWLCAKRLEGGMFAIPAGAAQPAGSPGALPMSAAQVLMLLEGIAQSTTRRLPQYHRPLNATSPTT